MARVPQFQRRSVSVSVDTPKPADLTPLFRGAQSMSRGLTSRQLRVDRELAAHNTKLQRLEEAQRTRIDNLKVMDSTNQIKNNLRNRYVTASQLQDRESLGIYQNESEYVSKQREKYLEELGRSGMGDEAVDKAIREYDTAASSYMDRIGTLQVRNNQNYESRVMEDTAAQYTNQAIDSGVGNMKGLLANWNRVQELYKGWPIEQTATTGDALIIETFKQWATIDPQGTVTAFDQNKELLQDIMGTGYSDLAPTIRTALAAVETQRKENEQLRKEQRDAEVTEINNDLINRAISGEGTDNIMVHINNSNLPVTGTGSKTWWIRNWNNVRNSTITTKYKGLSFYTDKAYEGAINETDKNILLSHVANMELSTSDFDRLMRINKQYTERPDDEVGKALKPQIQILKSMFLGSGLLGVKPGAQAWMDYAQARAFVEDTIREAKDDKTKMDLLNANSKNYIIMSAYNMYKQPEMQQMRTQVQRLRDPELIQQGPMSPEAPLLNDSMTDEEIDRILNQ